jgi:predicted PurR-regulated permease PerM
METWQHSIMGRLSRSSLQILLVAAAFALLAFVIVKLRLVVVPVVVALFLATFLDPPQHALERRGVPAAISSLIVMIAGIAVVALVLGFLAPRVADELGALGTSLQGGLREVTASLQSTFGVTDVDLNGAFNDAINTIREHGFDISRGLLSGAILIGETLAGLLLLLVILFFFLKDGTKIWSWFVDLFPEGQTRVDVAELGGRAWRTVSGYIRGIAVVATVDSVLIGIGLAILGVPLVLPLAALTFIAAFFPLVGAFTAGLVAALVALVAKGWVVALIVVVMITLVQQLEGDIIYPVVVGRAVSLHPVAILLAVTGGAVVAGILGALLAPPTIAVAWTVISYLRNHPLDHPPPVPPAAEAEPAPG